MKEIINYIRTHGVKYQSKFNPFSCTCHEAVAAPHDLEIIGDICSKLADPKVNKLITTCSGTSSMVFTYLLRSYEGESYVLHLPFHLIHCIEHSAEELRVSYTVRWGTATEDREAFIHTTKLEAINQIMGSQVPCSRTDFRTVRQGDLGTVDFLAFRPLN